MKILAVFLALPTAALTMAADFNPAATATNTFGVELFRQVAADQPGKSLLLSPYSIESAFAMAFAGAEGATRTEMMNVLHFPADDATLQTSFAALNESLDAMVKKILLSAKEGDAPEIEWSLANRLFGQRDHAFRESFLALLRDGYRAPFQAMNFRKDPEAARETVNRWVEEQTKNKIRNLIPPGGISRDSRLILVNALYLRVPWQTPFLKEATTPRPFHFPGSQTAPVATMARALSAGYVKRDGFTAVTVPYRMGTLQFLILLPDDIDGVEKLAGRITPEVLQACAKQSEQKVVLFLPKFRLEGVTLPLGKTLQAMGMKTAFDLPRGSANFDRMAPRKPDDYLAISDVFHQAFIAVDEQGTEASAATAVVMHTLASMAKPPPPPPEVHVDHPFLFAIQHRESGACLFLGRISDPR